MQVYSDARVVVLTDPATGEQLTLRFPSAVAFGQFVRRSAGASTSAVTALALQFVASGRACLSRESRPPRRIGRAQPGASRN
jgi:hypothetical protein